MRKIKFGIIGCGRIASRHAQHIDHLGQLVAVCDIQVEKAEVIASEYDVRSYSDYMDMFKNHPEIDVIAVCSPNGLHAKHTIDALKSGFHVLCEKPMAIRVHDCGEMIKEAEKANKRLFIVKQNRFNPAIVETKKIIDQNILGDLYSIQLNCFWNRNEAYYNKSDWKGSADMDGGTLYTQFSHFIDLIYWLIGDVQEVYGLTSNFNHKGLIDFEDTGVIALKFFNGVLGTINYTVNSYEKNMEGSLTIFGQNGTLKIGGQYLNKLDYQNLKDYEIGEISEGNPANEYGEYQGSMSNHDKVYQNIIEVLTNEGVIATNGFEGLKTVEIIDKIYKAASNN